MIEIAIPKLGLTMESAKLLRWQFSSGMRIEEGETALIIETDKVTFEVPSPASGIIHPVAPAGKTCAVEEVVGYIARDREEYERVAADFPGAAVEMEAEAASLEAAEASSSPADARDRVKASPLARAMAEEHHLDLRRIQGTGPSGRIVRSDILRALEEKAKVAARHIQGLNEPTEKEISKSIPISGIRKIIFDNMAASLSQSAQITLHTEVSAGALVSLRERLNRRDERISYNALLVKIVASALKEHPKMNASVEAGAITVWKQVHIGLAMEAQDALIVPVVRQPDIKTIREIEKDIRELIAKLRENRLSPDDLANGTFTISNLGFAEVDHFTPIIRPPESAILGVGRLVKKPVVQGDSVLPEMRLGLSLTFDHRIIDGAPAARFLKSIKDLIEDPLLLIR